MNEAPIFLLDQLYLGVLYLYQTRGSSRLDRPAVSIVLPGMCYRASDFSEAAVTMDFTMLVTDHGSCIASK